MVLVKQLVQLGSGPLYRPAKAITRPKVGLTTIGSRRLVNEARHVLCAHARCIDVLLPSSGRIAMAAQSRQGGHFGPDVLVVLGVAAATG